MRLLFAICSVLLPTLASAAGGHGGEGIPTVVIYQAINIAILIAGIIYFTKDAVIQMFVERKAGYLSAAQKSAAAREAAEKQFHDIKSKIAHMKATEAEEIAKAKAQAEEIKKQISQEANAASARIKEDAQLTVQLETKKAQKQLREDLLKSSMEAAKMVLSKDIGANDHQKLQGEFVNSIEVVR